MDQLAIGQMLAWMKKQNVTNIDTFACPTDSYNTKAQKGA